MTKRQIEILQFVRRGTCIRFSKGRSVFIQLAGWPKKGNFITTSFAMFNRLKRAGNFEFIVGFVFTISEKGKQCLMGHK